MNIGILGTGNLAVALGRAWGSSGHAVVIVGRNPMHGENTARQIGGSATAAAPADFARLVDVVVVAVAYDGLGDALHLIGADHGSLNGKPVIDCTNAIDYVTGRLKPQTSSAAEFVASTATGANVVKALHLFAGASWPYTGPQSSSPVVAICGDSPGALECAAVLITALGGRSVVIGGLESARQLEEAAGFVMRMVAAGANPTLAVPDIDPAQIQQTPSTDD
jgi:hypothetical protein